jgi:hypothetical protein
MRIRIKNDIGPKNLQPLWIANLKSKFVNCGGLTTVPSGARPLHLFVSEVTVRAVFDVTARPLPAMQARHPESVGFLGKHVSRTGLLLPKYLYRLHEGIIILNINNYL